MYAMGFKEPQISAGILTLSNLKLLHHYDSIDGLSTWHH